MEKRISSRGVPSSESIYLPRHDSSELRSFQDKNESITRNAWSLDEVTNFIFSKKYQPRYYEIAYSFLKLLRSKTTMLSVFQFCFLHHQLLQARSPLFS